MLAYSEFSQLYHTFAMRNKFLSRGIHSRFRKNVPKCYVFITFLNWHFCASFGWESTDGVGLLGVSPLKFSVRKKIIWRKV